MSLCVMMATPGLMYSKLKGNPVKDRLVPKEINKTSVSRIVQWILIANLYKYLF
jgi:hypothetical protein